MADRNPDAPQLRTIVIGLGNPVLGDDGVGWLIADRVEALLAAEAAPGDPVPAVDIDRLGVGGLALMERLTGYDRAILIDAAEFPDRPMGEVRSCSLEELEDRAAGHLDSAHDASLRTALTLGQRLGAALPGRIDVVTVQIKSVDEFSDELNPEILAAVPEAAVAVMKVLVGPDVPGA